MVEVLVNADSQQNWPEHGMNEIPADMRATLEDRVREQISSEVRGDVAALYEFTLPAIRARRVAEIHDERELAYSEIRTFVGLIREAEVLSIDVEQYSPSANRFGCPVALVVTRVRYNQGNEISRFRCLWVHSAGTWFSTSLGKHRFGGPPVDEPDANVDDQAVAGE